MKRAIFFVPLFLLSDALHAYQCPAPAAAGYSVADDASASEKLAKASYACGSAARGWKAPGHFRLTETVSLFRKRSVSLRTDLRPFGSVTSGGNAYLLVYSVKDPSRPHSQLVTAFPVGESFVKKLPQPRIPGRRQADADPL